MIQIMSLKKDVDFVLKVAQDCIDELEVHRENALKLGMQDEVKKLERQILDIRHIKADFDSGVALN